MREQPVNLGHRVQATGKFLEELLNVVGAPGSLGSTGALGLQPHQRRERGQMIGDAVVGFIGQRVSEGVGLRLRRLEGFQRHARLLVISPLIAKDNVKIMDRVLMYSLRI